MQPSVEKITPTARQSFTYKLFDEPGFPFCWHMHPEAELTLIVRGRGRRYVGDSMQDFREGDLVLLAPHLPHTWSSRLRRGGPDQSVVVQFLPDCFGQDFLSRPELQAVRRLLKRAELGLSFGGKASHEAGQTLMDMNLMAPLPRALALLQTLDRLASSRRAQPLSTRPYHQPLRDEDRTRIDRVCRFLEDRFAEPITLAEVAAIAHLHPASFTRFFRRMTGQTMIDYLHRLRVGHAARLLIETDHPITDICFESGFANISNFNRVFRKIKSGTPSAYRREFTRQAEGV